MSQYCKWDELKDKMLSLQKELCVHEEELRQMKEQLTYRDVQHKSCSEKLKIATAEFEKQNDVVNSHYRMTV